MEPERKLSPARHRRIQKSTFHLTSSCGTPLSLIFDSLPLERVHALNRLHITVRLTTLGRFYSYLMRPTCHREQTLAADSNV